MKRPAPFSKTSGRRRRAFTLVELLIICVTLFLAMMLGFWGLQKARQRALLKQCSRNLKQIGLGFRVFSLEGNGDPPMREPAGRGGSQEATDTGETFRHFLIITNELHTPKTLICPADSRKPAKSLAQGFSNTNLSYFAGLDAGDTNPYLFLSGDRNLTNGTPLNKNVLILTTNRLVGWTYDIHHLCGNILLADGSVQRWNISQLNVGLRDTGAATNRLQMP